MKSAVPNGAIVDLPTFHDFMIRKIPLKSQNTAQNQFVYPSFILQFKDVPAKPHKEVSDDKLSGRVYQMINHSISQKVNGPLGAILNQTKIF